ncbi:MAG: polyprenyl synthetase family protein [Porphyromonas sp.]|nr:polyprenyl synthetase family protein [Porphyromonas sp.]
MIQRRMDLQNKIKIVEEVIAQTDLEQRQPRTLYEPMSYTMALGGKRIRPLVLLLSYEAYRPEGLVTDVAPAMRAIELFHNFTLLHDDVMDDAPIRRGKPSVYKRWGANTAILSGDGMMIEAYRHLSQLPSHLLPESLRLFNDMATAVCEGQQYDMDFEQRPLGEMTIGDYVDMIRLKTSYLFCGAVSLGAYLADAPESDRALLWQAVELMGLAFQIKDDYLDVYSQPGFGKVQGGDILEGKRTWLLLTAYAKDPKAVDSALSITNDEEKIAAVTQLYNTLGVSEAAIKETERLSREAVGVLDKVALPQERIRPLKELFLSLVSREV